MSIIHEALKKAGRKNTDGQDGYLKQNLGVEYQRKRSSINWGPIFLLLVLLLITGPIVAPFFSTAFKSGNFSNIITPAQTPATAAPLTLASAADNSAATRKSQFAMEELPRVQLPVASPTSPHFSLSGIMYSANGSYCIINGKVVKIGGEVGNAKLIGIEQQAVKLLYRGQEITLSVTD